MAKSRTPSSDANSIHIQGSVTNAAIVAGRNNVTRITVKSEKPLPAPESVDIRAALVEIAETLRHLASPPGAGGAGRDHNPNAAKIEHALEEAEEEIKKPDPDRKEVGRALDRALEYAKAGAGFADAWTKLEPHVLATASWLGEHGLALLRTLGLT
jgi:hypothetical protein